MNSYGCAESPRNLFKCSNSLTSSKVTYYAPSFNINDADNFYENLDKAVMDIHCSHTFVGNVWFRSYVDSLSRNDKSLIQTRRPGRKYQFGDGSVHLSRTCVVLPIYIGSSKFKLNVDVLNCNVPLVLGTDTLKRANATIDKGSSTAFFFGSALPLSISSSGRLCIQIGRPLDVTNQETRKVLSRILFQSTSCNDFDIIHQARKLHLQFCHPSVNRLIDLVKAAGAFDEAICNAIKQVSRQCKLCWECKKQPRNLMRLVKQNPDVMSNHDHQSTSESESESESDGDDTLIDVDFENELDEWVLVNNNKSLPKVDSVVKCKFPNVETIIRCRIISRGGKSTTASWHFLNILEFGEGRAKCCSFKNVFLAFS